MKPTQKQSKVPQKKKFGRLRHAFQHTLSKYHAIAISDNGRFLLGVSQNYVCKIFAIDSFKPKKVKKSQEKSKEESKEVEPISQILKYELPEKVSIFSKFNPNTNTHCKLI